MSSESAAGVGDGTAVKAVQVRIEGRVQGVWFRAWTAQEARARQLSGWVRNRADGTVEAVFAGPAAVVDDMLAACWSGPPAAVVQDVQTQPTTAPDQSGFRQVATA